MTKTLWPGRRRLAAASLAVALLPPLPGLAQSKPAGKPLAVAGRYEGWLRGSSRGDAAATVVLVQDGAALTGTMEAGGYTFTIYKGAIDGDTLSWGFTSGDIDGSVSGVYKAGAITGTWSAMGSESGPLDLKKAPKPAP